MNPGYEAVKDKFAKHVQQQKLNKEERRRNWVQACLNCGGPIPYEQANK